jgi:hypothetical protein
MAGAIIGFIIAALYMVTVIIVFVALFALHYATVGLIIVILVIEGIIISLLILDGAYALKLKRMI